MSTSTEDSTSSDDTNASSAPSEVTEAEIVESDSEESQEEAEVASEDAPADVAESAEDEEDEEDLAIEVEVIASPLDLANEKIAELETAKKANYDRFVRATADLENVRKRSRKEVKDARLDERGKVLRDMLPVIDNLERASQHAQESEDEATKSILEGVGLVIRQFEQALVRHKVVRLDSVGKAFDPTVHEAVSQAPSPDHDPGVVMTALQTGYMMEDRLLRPALVVVSLAMPTPVAEESSEEESASEDSASEEESASEEPSSEEASSEEAESEDTSSDEGKE